jgi:glucose-1-phosphate thymidylyltransferase
LSQAVALAKSFVGNDKMLVLLGDNIFTHDLSEAVQSFSACELGAVIFGVEVEHPQEYGVIELQDGVGRDRGEAGGTALAPGSDRHLLS